MLKLSTGQGVANFILPLWRKIFPEKYLSQDLRLEIEAEKAPDRVSEGPGEEPRERERGKYREGPLLLLDAVGNF